MPYLGVRPADITSATEAEVAGDLTVDTNTLKVDATNNRVFVGASSGDRKFEVHDTGVVVANFKSTGANSLMAFDNSSDASQNHMIGFSGDDFRVVETTEKIRVLSSGGITFNGDPAAANSINDAEVGDWTPANASIASITFSSATGKYVKVGSFVLATGFVTYPSTSDSNQAKIGGLPFAFISNGHSSATISFKSTSNLATMNPAQNSSEMNLHTESCGTTTNANMSSATVYFAAMYRNA